MDFRRIPLLTPSVAKRSQAHGTYRRHYIQASDGEQKRGEAFFPSVVSKIFHVIQWMCAYRAFSIVQIEFHNVRSYHRRELTSNVLIGPYRSPTRGNLERVSEYGGIEFPEWRSPPTLLDTVRPWAPPVSPSFSFAAYLAYFRCMSQLNLEAEIRPFFTRLFCALLFGTLTCVRLCACPRCFAVAT